MLYRMSVCTPVLFVEPKHRMRCSKISWEMTKTQRFQFQFQFWLPQTRLIYLSKTYILQIFSFSKQSFYFEKIIIDENVQLFSRLKSKPKQKSYLKSRKNLQILQLSDVSPNI